MGGGNALLEEPDVISDSSELIHISLEAFIENKCSSTRTAEWLNPSNFDSEGNYLQPPYHYYSYENIDFLNSPILPNPNPDIGNSSLHTEHWKTDIYLEINGKWTLLFSGCSPFDTEYTTTEGHIIRFDKNKINLDLVFPKRDYITPDKINLYISLNQVTKLIRYDGTIYHEFEIGMNSFRDSRANYGGGHSLKFIDSNLFSIGTHSDSPGFVFFYYHPLSESGNWEDVISNIILKRMGALFTILSDHPNDKHFVNPVYTHDLGIGFSCDPSNNEFDYDGYRPYHKRTYNKWGYKFEKGVTKAYATTFWSWDDTKNIAYPDIQDADYIWSGSGTIQSIESNGREFHCLGAAFYPTSSDGSLPTISDYPFGNSHLSYASQYIDEGKTVDYIYVVKRDGSCGFIPLPSSIKPNTRYVIKNKPGVRIYNDKITRAGGVNILSSDDIIVEEYNL